MSNIFIYPDYYSEKDNGYILAPYGYATNEDLGTITSSNDTYDNLGLITNLSPETPTSDSYGLITSRPVYYLDNGTLIDAVLQIQILDGSEDLGELYLTDVVDFGEINLGSNPPSVLNYTTKNVDTSEDYGSLRYGLGDPFSIESYGLISQPATETESYELISTPTYSYGTTSKTTNYGSSSILYPQSPDDYELIANVSSENIDYGLLQTPYDEIITYGQIIYGYNEIVYPYGTFSISGTARERFTPSSEIGSGSISASGIKREAITDFYGPDSVAVDTYIESLEDYFSVTDTIDYGFVRDYLPANQYSDYGSVSESLPANQYSDYGNLTSNNVENSDYGFIISSADEVDSYGFLYSLITPFGLFNISGSARDSFRPAFVGSGTVQETGTKIEKNTDSYNLGSILPGGSSENYGSVGISTTNNESYGLITGYVDQAENYYYIFYPAGETVVPYGTIRVSGESLDVFKTQFAQDGSGSITANGVVGEAITKFYGIDSDSIDTNVEFSTSYGLVSDSVDITEDYGLVTSEATELDIYGFLYPRIVPFGLFNISGTAGESFKPTTYIGSGSIQETGINLEKNTDSYNINSVLLGGSSESYGSVGISTTNNESYGLITGYVDQVEDYHYVFYTAGENVTPFGTIQISGESFNELKIQFSQEGSGSITANGVVGEAITKFYGIDSDSIDTNVEFSTSYGLVTDSVDVSEDYGLVTSEVTELDIYGFLYPRIVPFGLFNISGTAGESFKPTTYIGSGSIDNGGIVEEKNTDSYNINSVLLGGSPEDYGSVGISTTNNESYGLITGYVDQVENYDYIFYPSGETIYPYGTIQISGESFNELKIQFDHEGSGSISASGVAGEAITKFYGVDSDSIDTNVEFSTSYGLVTDSVDVSEDYGLVTVSVDDVDSYGFLYPRIVPFGLFNISGSAGESFKPTAYIGSGSIENSGLLEERNTDSYNLGSILPGGSPEDYGSVGISTTNNESYGLITGYVDQAENYDYIFYPAGENVNPFGTIQISGDAFTELKIQFDHEGSGSISANGVAGEAITKFYGVDSDSIDTNVEFSTSYGLVTDSVDVSEDYGSITSEVTELDIYGFLYPRIVPFGLFNISGSAANIIFNQSFVGSGSIENSGLLEEKNTDSYNLGSILPGGSPEDYGSVGISTTNNEFYGLITAPVDQVEDYHYVFYTPGENVNPFGTIQISGDAFTELKIQFDHEGSGSISASGVAGEAITKFYSVDSDSIDSNIEFSTSYGLVSDTIDDSEDYGLITLDASELDIYGFLYPRIVPFGLFNISGTASESFKPAFAGSGSIENSGLLEEKNTDSYNINSVLLGGSPEDYGSVGISTTNNESYDLIVDLIDQVEDYYYVFYTAGENVNPFGTIQISGSASDKLSPGTAVGSGSISASGVAGEAITKFYGVDSDSIDTNVEFSTSYGLVSDSVDNTEDYGLIVSEVTELDIYGFLYPRIVPFGLFNISGTAGESFKPAFAGSGTVQETGTKIEKNTDSYNLGSILPGGSPEDYGSVGSVATESDSYNLIIDPIDQVEDYYYVFYTAGENVNPFGTIQISGLANSKIVPEFSGSGTINITGYALVPQRYLGSGNFSAFGGSAEVSGSNPPDQVVPIVISGAASDLKNTYSNVGSGTIVIDGSAATEVRGKPQWEGSGTIEITGTKVEKRSFSQLGSGTLFAINGSSEVSGSNPPDQVVPIVISGTKVEKRSFSQLGSGTLFAINGSSEVSGSNPPDQVVPIVISGTGAESFVPATAIGSGTFSALGGSAEVKGSNPPDQVVPIVISGTKVEKRSFSQLGSGTLFSISGSSEVSGSNPPDQVVTIVISGTAAESFIPATAIGSGTFSALGGSAEVKGSNPPDQVVPIVISGAATNLKNTYANAGSGTIDISGSAIERFKGQRIYFGSGTVIFSGTGAESFIPATAIGSGNFSALGGSAEVSGSNPPDQVVPIVISGAASDLKNTYANVGSGTGVFSGAGTNLKNTYANSGSGSGVFSGTGAESFVPATAIGSGTFSALGGSAEVSGSNPPDQVVPIVISGTKVEKRSFSQLGSGTLFAINGSSEVSGSNPPDQVVPIIISGTKIEKRSFIEVGSGTFSALGGSAEVSGSNPPDQVVPIVISGNARERFIPATVVGSGTIAESGVAIEKNTESDVGIGTITILGGITPDVQIYVPYWTGSGTFSALGGSAEVSGSNPPDQVVPIVISGNARERFTPATAVGSGIIELTGVGIGISNPYKAPYVYVTII
jgi:hypothetical protein